jgi:protein-S-isoprenylcysteine O-methyltransferase Ste14
MKRIIKQISSFILPVTVLVLVPLYIEKDISMKNLGTFFMGIGIICLGLMVMILTISLFITRGKGTLAPWSPTKRLITVGIYRRVRNPMIMGVLTILIGESIAIQSIKIGVWALVFFIVNNFYFILYEEPNLGRKFGEEYMEYKRNVGRWVPRITKRK